VTVRPECVTNNVCERDDDGGDVITNGVTVNDNHVVANIDGFEKINTGYLHPRVYTLFVFIDVQLFVPTIMNKKRTTIANKTRVTLNYRARPIEKGNYRMYDGS